MTSERTTISGSTVGMKDGMAVVAPGNSGNLAGALQGSTVTQSLTIGFKPGDMSALLEVLRRAKVSEPDLAQLKVAIEEEPKAKEGGVLGAKIGDWIGGMITKAAVGAWGIAVDKGSALLSSAIRAYYGLP